jgi:hypothetical protein
MEDAMASRPLRCTMCGSQAGVVEDVDGTVDWGLALVDEDGTVRPAVQYMEFHQGNPVRTRAVCSSPTCGHQWTLRRRFDPLRGERPPIGYSPVTGWSNR